MALSGNSVVVLSVNEACLPRVRRLWQRDGRRDVVGMKHLSELGAMGARGLRIVGVILDLARPGGWREDQFTWPYEAWGLTALVEAVVRYRAAPVLVVSAFAPLEAALRDAGVRVVAQLAPEANDEA